jgi:ribonuclease P protein component
MQKSTRLSGKEIRVLVPEKRLSSSLFSLIYAKRTGESRVAFTVSKKVAQRAVARNRIKRLMRDAIKQSEGLPSGYAIVLIAKHTVAQADASEIQEDIYALIQRIRGVKG